MLCFQQILSSARYSLLTPSYLAKPPCRKTCMMTGWGRLEQTKLVSIPGMLQEQLQHMATDVELTEEIHLAVMVKMMCMAAAVVAVRQEVAVEDMQMGGQLWTITKMASLGIQRKQNGPVRIFQM